MKGGEPTEDTLPANARSTIEPERRTVDDAGQRAVSRLARLQRGALTIDGLLGEGGMGQVHLATQTALGRKVAVKTLREGEVGPLQTMQLLREAWITGALEHPNVVPIYDVSLDADGVPAVVLRRIEGTEWSALMFEPELVAKRFDAHELLTFNLRVLMQVCNAAHFAHQRGILHRDLKPDNVMLGELGEVYLLDWGIAIAVEDDGSGRLSLLRDARQPAGTPAYMAPEMWAGDPTRISARTDVYLLGAILYEILTGHPPHAGVSLAELRARASLAPPLPETPSALVAICKSALDSDPALRPESALAFRRSIDDFLARAEAEKLVDEAQRGLARLHAALARATPAHAEIYNLYGACRFGFEQAIARIADVRDARLGLTEAASAMIEYELQIGNPRAAQTLLTSLAEAPPTLHARVDDALLRYEEEEHKRRALESLGRDWDSNVGRRTRLFIGLFIGGFWSVLPLLGALTGILPRTLFAHGVNAVAFLVVSLALAVWGRETLLRTQLNRSVLGAVILTPFSQLMMALGCAQLGINAEQAATLHQFLWFVICAGLALSIDWRIGIAALGYLIGFFCSAHWPGVHPLSSSLGNLVMTIVAAVMWLPMRASREGPGDPAT